MDLIKQVIIFLVIGTVWTHHCVRVGHNLDCTSARYITHLDNNVVTAIFDDSLIGTEYERCQYELRHVRVIIWGQRNCFFICPIYTDSWMHQCHCKVRKSENFYELEKYGQIYLVKQLIINIVSERQYCQDGGAICSEYNIHISKRNRVILVRRCCHLCEERYLGQFKSHPSVTRLVLPSVGLL